MGEKQGKVSFASIAKDIAKKEGKMIQVSYGNIREILSIVCDMIYKDENTAIGSPERQGVLAALYRNGKRRSKKYYEPKRTPVRD